MPDTLLHQLDQMFGLAAEPPSDERRTCGQGQADRIDRLLDVSEWHTFRLHTFSARRRGLACGQTINLVVHRHVQQIDIPAHRVDKVIAADSESVTVAACDDYAEVVIRKLDAGPYRQRQGRGAREQPATVQNFLSHVGPVNSSDNFHAPATTFALENVQRKNAFHQLCPGCDGA